MSSSRTSRGGRGTTRVSRSPGNVYVIKQNQHQCMLQATRTRNSSLHHAGGQVGFASICLTGHANLSLPSSANCPSRTMLVARSALQRCAACAATATAPAGRQQDRGGEQLSEAQWALDPLCAQQSLLHSIPPCSKIYVQHHACPHPTRLPQRQGRHKGHHTSDRTLACTLIESHSTPQLKASGTHPPGLLLPPGKAPGPPRGRSCPAGSPGLSGTWCPPAAACSNERE